MQVNLYQLLDYAEANPDETYDLSGCSDCLAARMTGLRMSSARYFRRGDMLHDGQIPYESVDSRFADLCVSVFNAARGKDTPCVFTGRQLSSAIGELIAGESPRSVGEALVRRYLCIPDHSTV